MALKNQNPGSQEANINNAVHAQAAMAAALATDPAPAAAPGTAPVDDSAARIAALEAQIAQLTELATRPGLPTISKEAVLLVTQPEYPITPGGTERPDRGPLHTGTGRPLFNVNRPTGRHG